MEKIPYSRETFEQTEQEIEDISKDLERFEGYYPGEYTEFMHAQQDALDNERQRLLGEAWIEAHTEDTEFEKIEEEKVLSEAKEQFSAVKDNARFVPRGASIMAENLRGVSELLIDRPKEDGDDFSIGLVYPKMEQTTEGAQEYTEDIALLSISQSTGELVGYENLPVSLKRIVSETEIISETTRFLELLKEKDEIVITGPGVTPQGPVIPGDGGEGPEREPTEKGPHNPFNREVIDIMRDLDGFLFRMTPDEPLFHNRSYLDGSNENSTEKTQEEGYTAFVFKDGVIFDSYKPGKAMYHFAFDTSVTQEEFDAIVRDIDPGTKQDEALRKLLMDRNYMEEASKTRAQRKEEGKRYKYHPRAFKDGKLLDKEDVHQNLVSYYSKAIKDLWGEKENTSA